jgi:hypothetical protein
VFTEFQIVRTSLCALSIDATFAGCLIAGLAFAILAFPFAGRHMHLLHRLQGRVRLRLPKTHFLVWLETRLQNVPGVVPVVVCCLMTGFGLGGLVASRLLHLPVATSVVVGIAAAIILIVAALSALAHLFSGQAKQMEGSSLIGAVCRVSLSIPKEGVGSVAYIADGKRHVISARSSSGHELSKGSRVLVTDLRNRVAIVEEL